MLNKNFLFYTFIFLTVLPCKFSTGQELVSNGDFETYTNCPYYVSQIHFAEGWSRPTEGTPDYFNACLTTLWSLGVPGNQFGDENAHSGNGYAGFYAFYSNSPFITVPDNDREYVSTTLVETMEIGKTYSVEFFVSLSEASKYGVEVLGLLFSTEVPHREDEFAITLHPQIIYWDAEELANKIGWTKISACFVADSAYQFLTIGNFYNGTNTIATFVDSQTSNIHYSYYYVDDISVKAINKPALTVSDIDCGPVLVEVSNFPENEIFEWNTGETASSLLVDESANIWASVYEEGCWVQSDTISVVANESFDFTLGEDKEIDFCEQEWVLLKPLNYSNENANYQWASGEISQAIEVNRAGTYSLSITNESGCTKMDEIYISDACASTIYLPNSFSPNGDGRNDVFFLQGHNISLLSFKIFDRWGKIVFASSDINTGWEALDYPVGLYVWQVEYRNGNIDERETERGSVLVLR